jgi:uncharacterized protein YeaO (DUF488 family)
MIHLRRVYEPPAKAAGPEYLVERLWPRGIRKADLPLEAWAKAVAPSAELRRWYGHEPSKWEEFQRRYRAELADNKAAWQPLLEAARAGDITLVYSARDTARNSAVVLKAFLDKKLARAR